MENVELKNQVKALIETHLNDLNTDILIELNHFVPRVKLQESTPVSYTHLDVYKRQVLE